MTLSVQGGFSYDGGNVQVTVSGTLSHSFAQSFSSSWSSSTTESFEVTFDEDAVGKSVWQFEFNITDSCKHAETSITKEFALTSDADFMPCCLPGHAVDMPAYTTCTSKEVMTPGGEAWGCKVQSSILV